MKKIAVIGRGSAGSLAALHFATWATGAEVEWHFDPTTPTQAVGEGSTLQLPRNLFECLDFSYADLEKINGHVKTGVLKTDWGTANDRFLHWFPMPDVAMHFCATDLQDFIFNKLRTTVKVFEHNVSHDKIDADFVMDCSGTPADLTTCTESEHICVNAVHVVQCPWEFPQFSYTIAAARPHGWVFCIPLQNRCSVGYLYNKNLSTITDVQDDIKDVLAMYRLAPSEKTNTFSFTSYSRNVNFTERVAYNGNASFFLEPLEATSIGCMDSVQRLAYDVWFGSRTVDSANYEYKTLIEQIERFLMMHYYAGSTFSSPFWEYAKERGRRSIEKAVQCDPAFVKMCNYSLSLDRVGSGVSRTYVYGQVWASSFEQNIRGLGIEEPLMNLINRTNTNDIA